MKFIKKHFIEIILVGITLAIFLVNVRINIFRYNNFDFGKFDLGNMSQMLWNTLNGRFMYLTDYFGTNLPRWAMSHVDPILLLFMPIFVLFRSPLSLVLSQVALLIFSSVLIYMIAVLCLRNKLAGLFIALAYLFYPALGYLTAITGFHGVSAAVPFFLGAFYVYEKMYVEKKFTKRGLILFWVLLIITMSGKEQLPAYTVLYGIFILLFRTNYFDKIGSFKPTKEFFQNFVKLTSVKTGFAMVLIGATWFFIAFFVIIPLNAHYRVAGYEKFTQTLGINAETAKEVALPNYFLARYEYFGDSYVDVIIGMLLNPKKTVAIFFGGDKIENARQTFEPVAYLPLLAPHILVISAIDFMANYLTTAGGIGTAEIQNHRISMIIPVLFISTIYAISYILAFLKIDKLKDRKIKYVLTAAIPFFVLALSIRTSYTFNNPVYHWITQAIEKRLAFNIAYAKSDPLNYNINFTVGDIVKLSMLDNKDVECAQKIVELMPEKASISGPDYLGAHLSMRETYALFPALYNEADYVIVDVFSQKLTNILDLDKDIVRDVVEELIKDENYELGAGCGNLFVFKKVGPHGKNQILPMQHRYSFDEKMNLDFFETLHLVDYKIPAELIRDQTSEINFTYIKRTEKKLDAYVMYTSFLNEKTGNLYQVANLPSFAITRPSEWKENQYYIEDIDLVLPKFLDPGEYKVFIGMSNKIRTRSMYLGNVKVL